MNRPTLDQVARRAGVSRATASRALSGRGPVAPTTRDAVAQAAGELGFTPNAAARSLARSRADAVALVVPETPETVFSDPFFATMAAAVANELADGPFQLVWVLARDPDPAKTVRYLAGGRLDGAIIASHHRRDAELHRVVRGAGLGCVLLGRPWEADAEVTFVDVAARDGVRRVTEHVIARGARRIATVAGPADMVAAVDRLAGFREALAAAGLPGGREVRAAFTVAAGHQATRELLARHPDLDAIVAASDAIAAGALQALATAGRRVPDDVRVVGFDDSTLAVSTSPRLTTVSNPVGDMARAATRLLLAQLDGTATSSQWFPARLVVRESS